MPRRQWRGGDAATLPELDTSDCIWPHIPYEGTEALRQATRLLRRDSRNGALAVAPGADVDRPHGLKYRLVYARHGRRLVGYDNERGKGDHKHIGDKQFPYMFVSVDQLVSDFMADVKHHAGEKQ